MCITCVGGGGVRGGEIILTGTAYPRIHCIAGKPIWWTMYPIALAHLHGFKP